MSALGQKRTWRDQIAMSALPPRADIPRRNLNVRFAPKGDVQSTRGVCPKKSELRQRPHQRGPALPVQSDRYVSAALSDINKTCSSKSLQSLATDLCRPLRCFCSDDRGEKFIGSYSIGEPEMARTKQASKRNRRSKAVPVLGAAGLSLSLASGASASAAAILLTCSRPEGADLEAQR